MGTLYKKYMRDRKLKKIMVYKDLIMSITESLWKIVEGESHYPLIKKLDQNPTFRSLSDTVFKLGYKININFEKIEKGESRSDKGENK